MAGTQRRSFRTPDERVEYPFGATDEVHLGESVVGKSVHLPGWRWSEHIRPITGTPSCQVHHVGVVVAGRLTVRLEAGAEVTLEADDVYDIPPGHDSWVDGDEPLTLLEWAGVHGWAAPSVGERVLATLMFTDIVESTRLAERLGNEAWTRLLEDHNATVRRVLDRFRGREVDTTGDGMFVMFDGAERTIHAAIAIQRAIEALDLTLRIGIHTGEVELLPGNAVRGVAVHVAARIMSLARPGEVLVSGTTLDLIATRDLAFEDRGMHELKGITGPRQIFALAPKS